MGQVNPVKTAHFEITENSPFGRLAAEQRCCGVDSCGTEETMLDYISYLGKLCRGSFPYRVPSSIHTCHPFDKQLSVPCLTENTHTLS